MQLSRWLPGTRSKQRNWPFSWVKALVLGAVMLPVPVWSSDVSQLPPILLKKIDEATNACAEFNNGEFALEWGSVQRVDLDGDLHSNWVLNEVGFACSTAVSLYCGTGGCISHFVIGDDLNSLLNKGWELVTFGTRRVLLADVHGSQCGGINPTPCTTASIWDIEERHWRSTTADWE